MESGKKRCVGTLNSGDILCEFRKKPSSIRSADTIECIGAGANDQQNYPKASSNTAAFAGRRRRYFPNGAEMY
jgi:hypothetical protein